MEAVEVPREDALAHRGRRPLRPLRARAHRVRATGLARGGRRGERRRSRAPLDLLARERVLVELRDLRLQRERKEGGSDEDASMGAQPRTLLTLAMAPPSESRRSMPVARSCCSGVVVFVGAVA